MIPGQHLEHSTDTSNEETDPMSVTGNITPVGSINWTEKTKKWSELENRCLDCEIQCKLQILTNS